jgi:hypothetical protein
MFSWFFGGDSGETGTLLLIPDSSGRNYAGFRSGAGLHLAANPGQTVGEVMAKFNAFRGPDEQITVLFTRSGAGLPFSTVVVGTLEAVVRKL